MHRRIIGSARANRGRWVGLLGVLLVGIALAARPGAAATADPPTEAGRLASLHTAARQADGLLQELIARLEAAIDAARRGTSLIRVGDQDPGPAFLEAAEASGEAAQFVTDAALAAGRVDGILQSVAPTFGSLPPGPDSSLAGIAAQLAASGEAAGPFIERRLAAVATLAALGDALAALDGDDPEAALTALERADASLATVADWAQPPAVLPVWLDTTGAMIEAARGIAEATLAGDPDAAAEAADAYRQAAEEARRADTALAIAIAESGNALAATPMRRLAGALAAATAQQDALLSVLLIGA